MLRAKNLPGDVMENSSFHWDERNACPIRIVVGSSPKSMLTRSLSQ